MIFPSIPLARHVSEMKALANQLIPYSFPIGSAEDEETISWMKQREITIDGYDVIVYFNKCQYEDVLMENLQVFGKYFSFLPFTLVCKVARKYVGERELSFVEVLHNRRSSEESVMDQYTRKIYIWTVYYNLDGEPIPNPYIKKGTDSSYDGLRFSHVDRQRISFF